MGASAGISIFFTSSPNYLFAAQEPTIRVLVKESGYIRVRADGNVPLLVKGITSREKKLSYLNLKIKNNQILWNTDALSDRWYSGSDKSVVIIRSSDPRGIWLGKRRYRGKLKAISSFNQIKVVNYVGIEKYLMSVEIGRAHV